MWHDPRAYHREIRDLCDVDYARRAGVLDMLFNCAGLLAVGKFDELSLEAQLNEISVNVTGVTQLTYAALPLLKATKDSRVITMARCVFIMLARSLR